MKKLLVAVLAGCIVLIIGFVINLLWKGGQFMTIVPHFAGSCTKVPGAIGAEDITIHPRTGIAFISSTDRRAAMAGKPGKGVIYSYDLTRDQPTVKRLTDMMGEDFQPHGIGLYVGNDGPDTLFAVNHEGGRNTIEIFDLQGTTIIHRKTLHNELMVSPNDIVGVGPEQFYFTNDHKYVSSLAKTMENYLQLKSSNIIYYDGSGFSMAATDIGFANGINVSRDGRLIYVAASTEQTLKVYQRNIGTGSLVLKDIIALNTGVDNIETDKDGNLWIGSHPQLLRYVKHKKDPSALSPSQVIKVVRDSTGQYQLEEIYLNQGSILSGSSAAAVRGNRLLIGPVLEPEFLDCRMD